MFTMGIDQYGTHYDDLGKYPRKELQKRIGVQHIEKMYVDRITTGEQVHTGYIISGLWITLYKVEPIN